MSVLRDRLPIMLALASERSDKARVELAGMLADLFLAPDHHLSLREEEQVNELIDDLLRTPSVAARRHLLLRFADVTLMPRKIARTLAIDSLDISQPILSVCTSLTDEDLVNIIGATDIDHAAVIATRQRISEAVADALVTTGDIKIMQLVAENMGATLTQKSVDVIIEAARHIETLREPIIRRPELSPDAAMRLYWWLSQELRRYVLKRFGLTSGAINEALSDAIAARLSEQITEKMDDASMELLADWLQEREAIKLNLLPQVLRMGHFRLFNILLSRMTGLTLSLVDTIMAQTGGRGIAALSRAINADKPEFVSLFLLSRGGRPGEQVVHPRELSYAIAAFDRLTPSVARDLLHSWTADPSYFAHSSEALIEEEQNQVWRF